MNEKTCQNCGKPLVAVYFATNGQHFCDEVCRNGYEAINEVQRENAVAAAQLDLSLDLDGEYQ